MALRDGNRIPGSVHDLAATLALSDVADQVIFVSPRTLRLLGDLAEVDVKILSRYVKSYLAGGMVDVVEDEDTEAEDVDEIANRFGVEVVPVGIYQQPWISSAYRAAATQTIANDTFTNVNLDTLADDIGEAFSLATDGVIIPTDGLYLIVGRVVWAGNPTGARELRIRNTGTEIVQTRTTSPGSGLYIQEVSHVQRFAADDNIDLNCRQTSGAALNLVQWFGVMNNSLSVCRLG